MDALTTTIDQLRMKLEKHRREEFKEYPTRVVFVDPVLQTLGWDVQDPEEVELEYTTIDGKAVDYALKINGRPVMFVEAKPLNDPLTDVKAISQVVSYTAIAGIEWCILTNEATYKVHRSTEKAKAPDKLLFEVSLDPKETPGMSIEQVALLLRRDGPAGLLRAMFVANDAHKALGYSPRAPARPFCRSRRARSVVA